MFRLKRSHPQAYINICVTRYCAHLGITSCFVWLLRRERYMGLFPGVLWDNILFETLLVEIYVGTAFLDFCS